MAPNTKRKAAQAGIVNNRVEPSRTKRRPPPMDPALLEQMYNSTNGAPSEYAVELTYLKSHPDDGQLVLDDATKYGMLQNLIDNQLTQKSKDDPSADALAKYLLVNITRAQKQVEEKKKAIDDQNKVVEAAARRAQDAKNAASPPPKPPPIAVLSPKANADVAASGGKPYGTDRVGGNVAGKWWAELPGYQLDYKIGAGLTAGGILLQVANKTITGSFTIDLISVGIVIPGVYLLVAKGLHEWKDPATVQLDGPLWSRLPGYDLPLLVGPGLIAAGVALGAVDVILLEGMVPILGKVAALPLLAGVYLTAAEALHFFGTWQSPSIKNSQYGEKRDKAREELKSGNYWESFKTFSGTGLIDMFKSRDDKKTK